MKNTQQWQKPAPIGLQNLTKEQTKMASYEMMGMISKNKFKKMDKQPDITGTATIDGKEMRIAGWQKTNSNCPYYSIKFSLKDEIPKAIPYNDTEELDDSIPF